MGRYIPPRHKPLQQLWQVQLINDQFPQKFGSHESLEKAESAIAAINQALTDGPDEIYFMEELRANLKRELRSDGNGSIE